MTGMKIAAFPLDHFQLRQLIETIAKKFYIKIERLALNLHEKRRGK